MPITSKPKHVKATDNGNPDKDYFTDGSPITATGTSVWTLDFSNSPCFSIPEQGTYNVTLTETGAAYTLNIDNEGKTTSFIPEG